MFPRTVEITVDGIPAKARVTRYKKHKGNKSPLAADPDEYFGWTELDYRLLDRNGRRAEWLEDLMDRKGLTEDVEADIREELDDMTQAEKEDWQEMKRKEAT